MDGGVSVREREGGIAHDVALIQDKAFSKWVDVYDKDEERFFEDFAKAFQKLEELGREEQLCEVKE